MDHKGLQGHQHEGYFCLGEEKTLLQTCNDQARLQNLAGQTRGSCVIFVLGAGDSSGNGLVQHVKASLLSQ